MKAGGDRSSESLFRLPYLTLYVRVNFYRKQASVTSLLVAFCINPASHITVHLQVFLAKLMPVICKVLLAGLE
jgi:hypothetical protein